MDDGDVDNDNDLENDANTVETYVSQTAQISKDDQTSEEHVVSLNDLVPEEIYVLADE